MVETRGRACGNRRVQGGIYAEISTSPFGKPIEDFLIDPPVVVPEFLGLPSRGVRLIRQGLQGSGQALDGCTEIWHIADRIGTEDYHIPLQWIEETRYMGGSRRIPRTIDFSKLTVHSRLIPAHDRAFIDNFADYYRTGREIVCPCNRRDHPTLMDFYRHMQVVVHQMCVGLYWHDGDPDKYNEPPEGLDWESNRLAGSMRQIGQVRYLSKPRPEGVVPVYRLAFFASLPIDRIVVVEGEDCKRNLALAKRAHLQVDEVPE